MKQIGISYSSTGTYVRAAETPSHLATWPSLGTWFSWGVSRRPNWAVTDFERITYILGGRWGPETLTDEPTTTITETMGLGEFQTEIDRTLTLTDRKGMQRDLTDDEIERAIAEIQATIKRYKT